MTLAQQTIGFIGSGNMAKALIGGLIDAGHPAQQMIASDPDQQKGAHLASQYGIQTTVDNLVAVNQADVLILAVKPQILRQVAKSLQAPIQQQKPLLISIAAGIRTETLQNWLGDHIALVRCMPNTPALLQAGATGLYATRQVKEPQKALAEAILSATGITRWMDTEADLDAVTALSGSGPAYFFLMLEAMEQAGQQLGLSAAAARQLSAQTALGAARMVLESQDSPASLRTRVTSPGGTTERAIQSMQAEGLEDIVGRAIKAAHARAKSLAQNIQ